MNKIWLIIKREYSTRVKNKTFLLTTFLAPLGIVVFMGALGFVMSSGSDDLKEIVVIDQSNLLEGEVKATKNIAFTDISINPNTVKSDKKVTSMTSAVGGVLGGVVGYAMFFIILIYGMQVMRSVMEEKISRIVEVIISSVKPFELMMGKVIGVGLVGLTQITIWLLLSVVLFTVGSTFFGLDASSMTPSLDPEVAAQAEAAMSTRLPMDPPMWQIAVSVLSLIAFVIFFTWLAGRIYRVGILMYGKKASFKELAKWIFYKG